MATQYPSYLERFINKALTSLSFPDDPELNLTAFDMGEDAATLSIDEETVKRLRVNFGDVGAVEMAVPATINVSIVKVVQPAETWRNRILNNGLVAGATRSCVFTDDTGKTWNLIACTIAMNGEISANGTSPVYNFTIKGTLPVNKELYGVLIG